MVRARKPSIEDAPSTGYGDEAALMRSTAEVPMGENGEPLEQAYVTPDQVPNLSDPTTRPDEPITTGLPMGPGQGPEVLGSQGEYDEVRRALRAMLLVEPNNDIMRLLDLLDIQGR